MKINEDHTVEYEDVPCWDCKGSGRRRYNERCRYDGQSTRKGCPQCGATRKADHKWFPKPQDEDCHTCQGKGTLHENDCSTDYDDRWSVLPIKVIRSDRRQTMLENLLGAGFMSVTDYGRYKSLSDEELVSHIKEAIKHPQYAKYVRDGRMADAIVVLCNDQGYSIIAAFGR